MLQVKSGTVTQVLHFNTTPSISSFAVRRKRGPNASAAMTISGGDITEDAGSPGLYALLLDEDMTITAGKESELMTFVISPSGAPVVVEKIQLIARFPDDALATDTYAEPTGIPPATATLAVKLGWLYRALRNRIEVNKNTNKKTFLNDSGVADWSKSLGDDGTTYSEDKAAGP